MHWPELWPPHGIPSIAGMSGLPGIVDNGDGEFGTRSGVHIVVYRSSDSPAGQAATDGVEAPDEASTTTAGVARAASANPPARMIRDTVVRRVAISFFFLVCWLLRNTQPHCFYAGTRN